MPITYNEVAAEPFLIRDTDTPEKFLKKIELNSYGIVFVINTNGHIIGSISDGDVRRAILNKNIRSLNVRELMNDKVFTVSKIQNFNEIVSQKFENRAFQAIPLLDDDHKVISVFTPSRATSKPQDADFVIMAGGRGTRLLPLTLDTPKPMLPLNNKPMIEHLVEKAAGDGFKKIIVSVNYKKEQIIDFLGTGEKWGVQIEYIIEDQALGTAGALSLWKNFSRYVVVTNCDVITNFTFSMLLEFTKARNSIATMAAYNLTTNIDYGVLKVDGSEIIDFVEKPQINHLINSGVYCLRNDAMQFLAPDQYCDMPTLFKNLKAAGHTTYAMPMFEHWIDVGRHQDLEKASVAAKITC